MEADFWKQRWIAGQTGFHQTEANPYLVTNWSILTADKGMVLVPLCGKSLDMIWLAGQGHHVAGVELSDIAVKEFLAENNLTASHEKTDSFEVYHMQGIDLFQGDFFDYRPASTEKISAVYDRASLIALPPQMRQRYARHLAAMLLPATPVLLVTMEYDQNEMSGPPFAVHEDEVRLLYGEHFDIDVLEEVDILAQQPQFRDRGLSRMIERVYKMVKK